MIISKDTKREKKYTIRQIMLAIKRAYKNEANRDSWNCEYFYESLAKKYIKKELKKLN